MDPRSDELKILINILSNIMFWGITVFVTSIPPGSRGCRTWIFLILLAMVIAEGIFQLTPFTIPNLDAIFPLTECEFILYMHRIFPIILLVMVIISEYYFVDIESNTALVLENVLVNQKVFE